MIFYVVLTVIILILIISFILYMFHSNRRGKHRKVTSSKNLINYCKEPNLHEETEKEVICVLTKDFIDKNNNSKAIEINKDITTIEDNCFFNCFNLSTISVDKENMNFCSKLGVLFSKDMKKIISYPPLKQTSTYFIPQGVEEISDHAFFNNNFLKYIILPTSLNSIGENSFINCKFLSQIVIPETVTEIHPKAFNLCPRVTIRCYKNSTTEEFCMKYFIPFEYLTN